MTKILLAECQQEVSSFNPTLSGCENFTLTQGEAFVHYHRKGRHEMGGALSVFDATPGVALVPTYSALLITPGGTMADAEWRHIAINFVAELEKAPKVDAAYFSMHGAIASESEPDCTGYPLPSARSNAGPRDYGPSRRAGTALWVYWP